MVGSECILCGRSNSDTSVEENGYVCVKCEQCRLMYVSNKPSEQEVAMLYQRHDHNCEAGVRKSLIVANRFHEWHNLSLIRRYAREGRLLELGPGPGQFLAEAKKRGYDVVGIEIDKDAAKEIRERLGIDCRDTPLSADSSLGQPFNIIYHCDVLSHFYDPVHDLRKMQSILADDGLMVFETGNGADMDSTYYACVPRFQLPIHLYFFGEESIRKILGRSGFEILEVKRYSLVAELAIWRLFMRLKMRSSADESESGNRDANLTRTRGRYGPRTKNNYLKLRRASAEVLHGLLYLARYHIGYVLPKCGRPQTLIVVARKLPDH